MRTAPAFAGVARAVVRTALWFCAPNLLVAVLAAQCSNPTQVPNQTISSGTYNFPDNNALAASNVIISGSASVTFVAGNCIDLQPGFRATAGTAGTTFHAWVETAPTADSVSPSSGSGLSQPFTWKASSPSGYTNLSEMYALFNTSVSGQNACYIRYNRSSNLLYLADNSGSSWLGGFVPGSSGTTGNSQCSINASGSSVSGSGTQLTLTVSVTFQTAFSGTKNDYLIAYNNEGLNSTWQQMGTWTVPASSGVQHVITTSPGGLSLTVDGGGCTSPCTFYWAPGTGHTIATTATQPGGNDTQYVFANWSDGGALSHSITASSSPATYTATFTTQYYLRTAAGPGGTISPASAWYNSGTVVTVGATAGGGYQFWGFSGSLTGTTTPQNLAMTAPKSVTATFAATTIAVLNNCIRDAPQNATCTLASGTHLVTESILIGRSNVTVTGGSSDRTQTKLVRSSTFTEPILRVDAASPLSGITMRDLAICGSSILPPGAPEGEPNSGCPRPVEATNCGKITARHSRNQTIMAFPIS